MMILFFSLLAFLYHGRIAFRYSYFGGACPIASISFENRTRTNADFLSAYLFGHCCPDL